ncbi:hypothetical protein GCM10022224_002250 [Nonomuraea antimicrobica]|uniref:Secreted protein n=1 Tax=Nonomuraea antimicrobica TaxID=561173 RepID=A0ABP7AY20_9ACTN
MRSLRRGVTVLVLALVAGLFGAALTAVPAQAEAGWIAPGSTVCTGQTGSGTGVVIHATNNNGPAVWTVRAAATAGGQETEIFRRVTAEIPDHPTITHPTPGFHFYRMCVTNPRTDQFRMVVSFNMQTKDPAGQAGAAPLTAVLTPHESGGSFCGGLVSGAVRFVANSDVPVQFRITGVDGNDRHHTILDVTGTAVDQAVTVPPDVVVVSACVHNSSSVRATASYDLRTS